MSHPIDRYIPIMKFMAEMLGPDTEVILYNVETRTVHQVINPMDEEMVPGSEMRSLERSFLDNHTYEKEEYIVNYRALSKRKNKLKSATLFLHAYNSPLDAILTVNMNVDRLVEMRDMLNVMVSGTRPYDDQHGGSFYNSFDVSVEGMISTTIVEEMNKYHVDPSRLSHTEKLEIVRSLDQKGVFLVKGSITELATAMQTTETTIYRYLNKLSLLK